MMSETEVITRTEVKVKKPGRYHVVLLNDDYTPFEFVITILIQIFGLDQFTAIDLSNRIHHEGRGIAGTYIFEVAEQKKIDTMTLAQTNGYPLQAILEAE